MIRFEKVTKRLGSRNVLDEIDLEIQPGETYVICGPSGMGKSVTLRHMVRLLTPDAGRVLVDNECVSESRGRDLERIRARFGVLFQSGALLQWLSVAENVALPLRERPLGPTEAFLTLTTEPGSARVRVGDRELPGASPYRVRVTAGQPVVVVATAPGHTSETRTLRPAAGQAGVAYHGHSLA